MLETFNFALKVKALDIVSYISYIPIKGKLQYELRKTLQNSYQVHSFILDYITAIHRLLQLL